MLGWRGLFFVFGALGLPLLAVWLAVVPKPPQLPGTLKAETPTVDPIMKTPVSPVPGEVPYHTPPLPCLLRSGLWGVAPRLLQDTPYETLLADTSRKHH